jgi:hypothetical protein
MERKLSSQVTFDKLSDIANAKSFIIITKLSLLLEELINSINFAKHC